MAITERMVRASRLDPRLYEEVEADPGLTREAATVVLLSALGAGIGGVARGGILGLVVVAVTALLAWYVWAYLTYWIGTRVLPGAETHADVGQMLRVLGFASAPGVLRVLGIVPGLGALAFPVANVWMLVTTVVAVRQALDYTSTWRALAVVALGWLAYLVALALVTAALRAGG
ncbi:MAG: YIP1 family protein [Armatimonadota bacterium]|nr:YIP1 family protein [Armatimonadota bacterium]